MIARAVLAVALVAGVAVGEEPVPPPAPAPVTPSSKFGVVFNLQNIFQNPGVLSGFNGGVGFQYAFTDQVILRPTVSMSRSTNTPAVTETTVVSNGMTTTTKTFNRPTAPTSTFGLTLGADVLYRLLDTQLAPYVGGGLFVNYSSQARVFRDDTVMDQVLSVNDLTTAVGIGAGGILGVSWRIHPHFSLFAEYSLDITIFRSQMASTSTERTAMGETTSAKSSTPSTKVFEFSTGLSQGASLGVVATF